MMPMGMPPPQESTWEDIVKQLEMQIANAEKNLLLYKAQLKEAQSHVKE